MQDDTNAPALIQEVATTGDGRDPTKKFVGDLQVLEDSVLAAKGSGLELYDEVLRDDQVFSTFLQRRRALVSCEWEVRAGADDSASQKAADQLTEILKAIPFDRASDKMLYGLFYGYSTGECMWVRDGSHIALETIKVRRARRFRFDADNNLRLLTKDNKAPGELMPPRKFWTFSAGADNDDNPYGLGLGHQCYWPAFFKRHGIKYWSIFLDKVGVPTAKGTYPKNATQEDIDKLLGALAAIKSDSGIAIPEGMVVEFMAMARTGAVDHSTLPTFMNAAISKVILGQTMTTDDGASLAQGKVHMEVRDDIVKGDGDLLSSSFNSGPAAWLTAWNFPGATPPKVWRLTDPPEDLILLADRDTKIYELGYKPTPEYITETYGDGWVPDPSRRTSQGSAEAGIPQDDISSFAEPDEDAISSAVSALTGDEWQELLGPIVEPLMQFSESAASLEEIRDRLIDELVGMDETTLGTRLAQLGFAGRLAGAVGAPLSDAEE